MIRKIIVLSMALVVGLSLPAHALEQDTMLGVGFQGADTPLINKARAFEDRIGRKVDITRHYIRARTNMRDDGYLLWALRTGRTPFINLEFLAADNHHRAVATWRDIYLGREDATLLRHLKFMKEAKRKIIFSLHHEPENEVTQMGGAADYRRAWAYVRQMARRLEVRNLVWTPVLMRKSFVKSHLEWLPASKDYDWVGADGYNRGACADGWRSFAETHRYVVQVAKARDKRVFLGEVGTVEGYSCGGNTGSKPQWFEGMRSDVGRWPIAAVVYSNVVATHPDTGPDVKKVEYWIESSSESTTAFRRMANSRVFT